MQVTTKQFTKKELIQSIEDKFSKVSDYDTIAVVTQMSECCQLGCDAPQSIVFIHPLTLS